MIKIHLALWFALWPTLVTAQTAKSEYAQAERITKVVRVRYGSATVLAGLAGQGAPVSIRGDNALRAVVINGNPSAVAEAERTIRELDTPNSTAPGSKDVELTVYIIEGSDKSSSSAVEEKLTTITPVVKQLRSIFAYKNYQLLSTMLLRSGEGTKAETQGLMKGLEGTSPDISPQPSVYGIRYESATVSSDETPSVIHLSKFRFNARVAIGIGSGRGENGKYSSTQWQSYDVGIETDLDLKEGQRVVVGKSNIESSDSALFIVLSAKLTQ